MNRVGLSISSLFVLALLVYLPSWLEEEQSAPISELEEAWRPNYQANNLRTTLYDENGRINHQVTAVEMEHYELLGFVLFKQPQYTLYLESSQQPWQLTAQEGTLYDDNRIQLEDNVVIRSLNPGDFVQQITAEFIEIDLENKTMMSDQPVVISGIEYTINSNGFVADLETKQYELLDHVQTLYAPRS
ncbi:LPS export ABC transporter periplasmic protein LptC [Aestuariibacter salexigens]|uniref:LPS export ABC transporter periplasmic protein LptC n=1 Tax=Aestuariibacter salexigens TaxID=226010 RepID=UPI0003FC4D28|nr:LPS export ABC transporter periplasmic protein LptC [Aestuariibacter salexigens]